MNTNRSKVYSKKMLACSRDTVWSFEVARDWYIFVFLDSSMVEHSAVNRVVVGSSPTRGAHIDVDFWKSICYDNAVAEHRRCEFSRFGSVVKRLRHRPFTAVTRVRFPSESLARWHLINKPMWLNWQSSWFVISRLSVRVRSSAFFYWVERGQFFL